VHFGPGLQSTVRGVPVVVWLTRVSALLSVRCPTKPGAVEGYIDTSGYGGGPNAKLELFPAIPGELLAARSGDLYGEAG
jgi:hypothetical protein